MVNLFYSRMLFTYRLLVRGQVLEQRVKIIFQMLFGDFFK